MHSEVDLAYTAGLLDGEGSIVIGLSKRKKSDGVSLNHWLQVGITGTDKEMIDWLKNKFGGHISDNSHSPSRRKQRPCWAWRVMGNQASEFLKLLIPYVKSKRHRAVLAIEFQEKVAGYSGYRLTDEVVAKRQWYKDEISKLNLGHRTLPD